MLLCILPPLNASHISHSTSPSLLAKAQVCIHIHNILGFCIFKHSPARDPADYEGISNAILSFGPCDRRSCLSIAITNGNFEVERDEIFYLRVQTVRGQDNRIRISPGRVKVVIKDNDGEQLSHNVYNCDVR